MITRRVPDEIPCQLFNDYIERTIHSEMESIEIDVYSFGSDRLVSCTNIRVFEEFEVEDEIIDLENLLKYMYRENPELEIVLNLKEAYLETRAKTLVEKLELKRNIRYCGKVKPGHLTPWDRRAIQYNVENALPNVYQLEYIKRTHFDVIHYFCTKHKVKTIRIRANYCSEDVMNWAESADLQIVVCGVEDQEQAQFFLDAGVERVVITDSKQAIGTLNN